MVNADITLPYATLSISACSCVL